MNTRILGMDVITSRLSLLQIPNIRSARGSLYIRTGRDQFHSSLHLLMKFKTSIRNFVVSVDVTTAQGLREWSKIPELSGSHRLEEYWCGVRDTLGM
jgi:hypothetical protein